MHKTELEAYRQYLFEKELSDNTIDIYVRQAQNLLDYLGERPITKKEMILYKKFLFGQRKRTATINLYIVAVNSYLKYQGYKECVIRTKRLQRSKSLENVISIDEYRQMINFAKETGREKYYYIMKTLAYTGMRISELQFLTVEAVAVGRFTVENKGKIREVYVPSKLAAELSRFCEMENICAGVIFKGNCQKPITRIAVYRMLLRLAELTGIETKKAHPHSFRHLFALTYMKQYGNLTELADILGHSSLETTRIYTTTTAEEKRRKMDGLKF